jgi:hypothetical protein
MAKQRPIYTKAQHQIVTPAFVEKKIQLHKSIKWTTKDDRDLFIMVSGSVTRYVPKSEHNSRPLWAFLICKWVITIKYQYTRAILRSS